MKAFRSFRLDPVNQCLWHGGNRVALTPKAFDMLRYLVEHPGRLVTQDEILEALWPETYVNPEIIKKYILEIRKGLGDRHDKPEFIQTFPKRGYQFVAAVSDEVAIGSPDLATAVTREMVGRDAALAELHHSLQRALHGERRGNFREDRGEPVPQLSDGRSRLRVDLQLRTDRFGQPHRLTRYASPIAAARKGRQSGGLPWTFRA